MGGQLLAIAGNPRRALDDARDRARAEGAHVLVARDGAYQPRIKIHIGVPARHFLFEIGLHLEQLAKIRIVCAKQVVKRPFTDQDDL